MAGHPPRGRPPTTPAACSPHRACRPRGQCWVPHPHTRAHSTWVADPNSPPSGRAVGGGTAPDLRRPSQWWKAPPPGTPSRHPHSEQRRPARAHAMGPVLGPRARTDRTRDTRVAEPRLPAPEDGRPGEGQRLTPPPPGSLPSAPHNGGRPPPPRGRPPTTPTACSPHRACRPRGQCWAPTPTHPRPQPARGWRTPTARPVGGQSGEGRRLASDAPHNGGRHPPRGRPSATPTASNAGPQGRTLWGRCWVPTPAPTAPGTHWSRNPGCPLQRTGGRWGTAPDTRRPSQRWQATPPGDGPPPPPRHATPQGRRAAGTVLGPHTHTPAPTAHRRRAPTARPVGGQSGDALLPPTAPGLRRPPQWWKAPPTRTPFCHPHSEQRRPARAHAVGPVPGPHARTDRTRDTRVAEPWLPAPEDGRPGEGQRLTPSAPHNGGRPPPPGTAPHDPHGMQPPQGMQAAGTVLGPHTHTPTPTARGWRTPTARPVGGQSGEGQRLTSDAPHNGGRHPPRGRPSATPTASNAGPQGRTLWGRCRVPAPAPTAPGTHGSRNPGCPLQRTGGRGRDSA